MFKFEKILKLIIVYFYKLIFRKNIGEEKCNNIWQFIQFAIIGLANTMINYIVYLILIYFGLNYIAANIIGFFISVLNAFYWNNKWVFLKKNNENRHYLKAFIKTFTAYAGTGLILNNILLVLWVKIFNISTFIAPIINLIFTVPVNFILNKFWAFASAKAK